MKIGLTTYSLDNKDFREQLSSMLKNGIKPDFIILHYGGIHKFSKRINFIRKTIKQRRLKTFSFLSSYGKKIVNPITYKLSEDDSKQVSDFISTAKIINRKGINDASTVQLIKGLGDVIVACNSGKLNLEVIGISSAIFLNVHASKLPMYRGMNNVEWALWENNELFATIHRISKGIDEGDILLQEKIDVDKNKLKSISDYRAFCFFKSNDVMGKAIKGFLDKKLSFVKQDGLGNPLAQYYTMHPILKGYLNKNLSSR